MLTRCLNDNCKHTFDVLDELSKQITCPKCGQIMSLRSLEALEYLEKLYQKYLQQISQDPNCSKEKNKFEYLALLEDIRSMWNVGSMFRTADGAGFDELYLCGITAHPPRKELAKTSLGAENSVAWQYFGNSLSAVHSLKQQGVFILGLESDKNSISLVEAIASKRIKKPLCLLVGNEVAGLSAQMLDACDLTCHIPMRGMKESLNAAVAFGIAAYMITELMKEDSEPATKTINGKRGIIN